MCIADGSLVVREDISQLFFAEARLYRILRHPAIKRLRHMNVKQVVNTYRLPSTTELDRPSLANWRWNIFSLVGGLRNWQIHNILTY